MLDKFDREINYLRISLLDRCNLNCIYCKTGEAERCFKREESLNLNQIEDIVRNASILGINKVRLTGGEPLLYENIDVLIKKIRSVKEIQEISITTNGILLAQKAELIKNAGLDRINISLDTLNPEKYSYITGGGNIFDVLNGIEAARQNNIPTKINMVVLKDINDDEIQNIKDFCHEKNLELQLIKHFELGSEKINGHDYDRPPDCKKCNRLRLLSDGVLKPCLHSELEYKINFGNIQESIIKSVLGKPKEGRICSSRKMVEIGG